MKNIGEIKRVYNAYCFSVSTFQLWHGSLLEIALQDQLAAKLLPHSLALRNVTPFCQILAVYNNIPHCFLNQT
jgi:hypothetical protein